MYKAAGCTMKAEFGLALKAAWAEAKAPKTLTLEGLITRFNAKAWTHPGTGEIRYYVNFEKAMGFRPQTNSEKAIKIWFTESGELAHSSKSTSNDEYIRRYVTPRMAA